MEFLFFPVMTYLIVYVCLYKENRVSFLELRHIGYRKESNNHESSSRIAIVCSILCVIFMIFGDK